MMNKMTRGRMVHAPLSKEKRTKERHRMRFFLKAALISAITVCLAMSAIFVSGVGKKQAVVAFDTPALPVDDMRIDASGVESILKESIIDPRLILGIV